MNLKILAILSVVVCGILAVLGFVFAVPIAYVPDNASTLEFVLYHMIFVLAEISIVAFLFFHMINTLKLNFDKSDLTSLFKKS